MLLLPVGHSLTYGESVPLGKDGKLGPRKPFYPPTHSRSTLYIPYRVAVARGTACAILSRAPANASSRFAPSRPIRFGSGPLVAGGRLAEREIPCSLFLGGKKTMISQELRERTQVAEEANEFQYEEARVCCLEESLR